MATFKRYKGKKLKPVDPDWDKGTWVVEFKLRGHRVHEAIPEARTAKQAQQAEVTIRQAIFDRKYNRASSVTRFADFVDNVFLKWAEENKRSWKDDRQLSRKLKVFFKSTIIRDITPLLIEKFKSKMRKEHSRYKREYSPATINRTLQVLSRILSMAFENGIIDSNPMSRVKRLREPEARDRYLNQCAEDEEERLINALAAYGEHPVAMAELDLETGLRLGELLNLRWQDIHGDVLDVTQTKTDKPRRIPLTRKAQAILRRLRQDAPIEEKVFDPKRTGRRRRQLIVCFERAVKAAKLDDFHFHDLRRTFATRLRASNVHAYDIADLLGHSVPEGETRETRITKGYARAVPERLRNAVSTLEKGKLLTFGTPSRHQQEG